MSSVALKTQTTQTTAQRRLALATRVMRALHGAHVGASACPFDLDRLCAALGVGDEAAPARDGVRVRMLRREDVRETVRRLDAEGFVDGARMRLTLAGFALASSLSHRRRLPLHRVA